MPDKTSRDLPTEGEHSTGMPAAKRLPICEITPSETDEGHAKPADLWGILPYDPDAKPPEERIREAWGEI